MVACTQVAEHLSASYGDRAFKVARLAQLTGKRWPVVGKKLHDDYPYIEAEVRRRRRRQWRIVRLLLCRLHTPHTHTDTRTQARTHV